MQIGGVYNISIVLKFAILCQMWKSAGFSWMGDDEYVAVTPIDYLTECCHFYGWNLAMNMKFMINS